MQSEPQYFDCDDEGSIPEERKALQIPKWRQTQTQFQVDILNIFQMKYFPKEDRDAKIDLVEIERGMALLAAMPNLKKLLQESNQTVTPYPKEWVDFASTWASTKRHEGVPIKLRGLINFIKNKDRMISWLEKNTKLVFVAEKKYETRKEVMEVRDANMETNITDYGD